MVAQFFIGTLVETFVRIPESGLTKSAKPAICDLGNISTLASTIDVSRCLPSGINVLTQTPITNNQQRKRSRFETKEDSPDLSSPSKFIRMEKSSDKAAPIKITPVVRIVAAMNPNSDIQKLRIVAVPSPNSDTQKISIFAERNSNPEVLRLMKENQQLKAENIALKKQISLFKQLFRYPQRIKNILSKLENK